MKNYGKTFLTVLLSALMVFAMSATAFADDGYTVKLFSGKSGLHELDGGNPAEVISEDVAYGNYTSLKVNVKVNDDKYYVKGVKQAGKDTKEGYSVENGGTFSVKVEKDADYVVDYGAKEAAKAYTVNFLTNEGKELAPSETHYGDAGDSIIVASKYIDGYIPAALNLSKTLSVNEDENVFTFYYREGSYNNGEVIIINNGGNAVFGRVDGNGAVDGANGADGAVNVEDTAAPRELVNLDEEETPLANVDLEKDNGMSTATMIAIGAGALVLIAGAIFLILKKKRESEEY